MASFKLYLLGAPRLEMDGEPVIVDTRKAIALLAYMVVTAASGGATSHTRDALAALLWPELDQSRARAALRRTLSPLRQAVDKRVLDVTRDHLGIRLDVVPDPDTGEGPGLWVDVVEFRRLLDAAAAHEHDPHSDCPACRARLEKAVDLYRDDFMAGFTLRDAPQFDEWHYFESEQLRRALSEALERLTQTYAHNAKIEQAIAYARRHLTLDPLSEQAHRNLMQLYAWSGQRSAAVRQYRECVRVLEQELGVPPLEETTALYEQILGDNLPPPPVSQPAPPAAPPTPAVAPARPSPLPLVGRETHWQRLQAAYETARERGFLMVIEGEAGVGKTRLVEEFVRQSSGMVIRARCYEGESNLTYSPFIEALRHGLEQAPAGWQDALQGQWLAHAARLLPELRRQSPLQLEQDHALTQPLDGPGAQSRFFEAVCRVLLAFATAPASHPNPSPGILFIDDVQWADDASLDLLAYLIKRLANRPLLLLVTWRPEALPATHRLHTLLANAQRSNHGARITLDRLNPQEVDALVDLAQEAGHAFPDAWRRRLYRESEGLPFFVVEYLQSAPALGADAPTVEQQAADAPDGEDPSPHTWDIPPGVRGLLQSRLDGVDEIGWQLLNTAAVIGRSFDFDACRLASGRSEEEAVAALERLLARGLIVEETPARQRQLPSAQQRQLPSAQQRQLPPGMQNAKQRKLPSAQQAAKQPAYDFSHSQIRALVYERTSLARRRLLHRRVAEALIQSGREEAQAAQIAHHYRQAGQDAQAATYYVRAGERARALYANAAALSHLRTALALDHPDAAALHEAIGELHTLLGAYGEALTHFEAAAALAPADPANRATVLHQARLEHKLGNVYDRRGEWQRAESHFQAALEAAAALEADRNAPADEASSLDDEAAGLQARILADWSLTAHHQGHATQALQLAQEARELAQRAQDDDALAQVYNILGILARHDNDLPEAQRCLQRSLHLATASGHPSARIAALNNLALVYAGAEQEQKARETLQEALSLCQKLGDRHREAALLNNLADLHHASGRVEEAMTHLKRAAAIFVEIGDDMDQWTPEIWKLTEW